MAWPADAPLAEPAPPWCACHPALSLATNDYFALVTALRPKGQSGSSWNVVIMVARTDQW
jgi:hypothetical protein